ncbi:hypothetical protein ACFFHF_12690, partial [Robertmurraya beringensis]
RLVFGVVTSLFPKIQGVAIFLLKKPSIKVFYSLFNIKVLTIREALGERKNEKDILPNETWTNII